jgi:hypothetical protein
MRFWDFWSTWSFSSAEKRRQHQGGVCWRRLTRRRGSPHVITRHFDVVVTPAITEMALWMTRTVAGKLLHPSIYMSGRTSMRRHVQTLHIGLHALPRATAGQSYVCGTKPTSGRISSGRISGLAKFSLFSESCLPNFSLFSVPPQTPCIKLNLCGQMYGLANFSFLFYGHKLLAWN